MSVYDVSDIYPATVEIRDAAGTLVNASSVTFTFTFPDATTTNVTPANPSTGRYTYDLLIAQFGLHRWRGVSTGPNTAYGDAFNVVDPAWPAFIGLAEAKDHLNIPQTTTTYDEELRLFILTASAVVEDIVNTVVRRTFTETYSGRGDRAILLRHRPVISVTSVSESGVAVASTDYSVTPSGVLSKATAYSAGRWARGVDNVAVVYQAGRPAPQPNLIDGTRELIRVNWRPQVGGNYSIFDLGKGDDFGQGQPGAGEVRLGFFVPNTVMERLQPQARAPHVA